MKTVRIAAIVTLVLAAPAGADVEADRIARIEQTLRPAVTFEGDPGWSLAERMEHYGVPGVGIAVIQDFEVAWFRTYGLADRETGEPVTTKTLFQAGSVSKPVAAFGALKLVMEGKLTLDGDVNDRLKSWKVLENEHTAEEKVTLTRLLSHTAGLTVHGFPGYAVGETVPTVPQVLDGSGPANTDPVRVDLVPGSQWRYSGGGYTVAQLMMSDVTGQSFPELMRERVLAPIGMKQSTFENPLPAKRLARAAAGYLPDNSAVEGKRHTYPEMAAAGLWTTAEDLARFASEVQKAHHGKSRVLSLGMAGKMLEPIEPGGFGRGFALPRRDESPYFAHNGWDEGFCALLLAHRTAGYGIAVMINSNHPDFMEEIVRAVAQEYGWAGYKVYGERTLPEVADERYPGRYRYNAEQAFTLFTEDGRLFLRYAGGSPEELLYVGKGRYMRRERTSPITFTEEDGEVVFHFVLDDGGFQSHRRLGDDERQPRELLLSGTYEEALAAYREVLEADPEEGAVSPGYLGGQAFGMFEQGRVEEAILLLRVALDLHPGEARLWDGLGQAYREAGEREKAMASFRAALERDPELQSARQALAELERDD